MNTAALPVYFGCWGGTGHFCWYPDGRQTPNQTPSPWRQLDGALCPGWLGGYQTPESAQIEGHAALHHKEGWTALAFWDRSVDRRGGSNSVFLFHGTLTGPDAIAAAREAFPSIWARYRFEVKIVSAPSLLTREEVTCSACGTRGLAPRMPGGWAGPPWGWLQCGEKLACSPGCAT